MPFKSEKQKKLILAAAHNPDFAKKVGFPQQQAQKFLKDSMEDPFKDPNKPIKFKKISKMFGKKS